MDKKGLANGKEHVGDRGKDGALQKQSNAEFRPGEITWIKLRGAPWWPAQVHLLFLMISFVFSHKPRIGQDDMIVKLITLFGCF